MKTFFFQMKLDATVQGAKEDCVEDVEPFLVLLCLEMMDIYSSQIHTGHSLAQMFSKEDWRQPIKPGTMAY